MRYLIARDRTKIYSSNGQERLNVIRTIDRPDKEYFICQRENDESDNYSYFIEMKTIRSLYKTNTIPVVLRKELNRMKEGW